MQHGLPLQEAPGGRSHRAVLERLPVGPAAHRLLDVAGAGENLVAAGAGLDFDAAEAGKRAGIQHVAGVFVRLRMRPGDTSLPVLPVPMRMSVGIGFDGQAESLLRFEMADVGVGAVVGDAEDVAAIAGEREQAVGARGEGVDNVIFVGPELARRLVLR